MATCVADLEAILADAEAAVADLKKGDPASIAAAFTALEDLLSKVETLKTDCTATENNVFLAAAAKNVGDMATCVADLEAILADAEAAVADLKKGDPASIAAAFTALEDLLSKVETLKTDCTASLDMTRIEKVITIIHSMILHAAENVGDMATCVADLEAILADAEAAVADLKKGDPAAILAAFKALEDLLSKVETL